MFGIQGGEGSNRVRHLVIRLKCLHSCTKKPGTVTRDVVGVIFDLI
jgi:hypothetical protein